MVARIKPAVIGVAERFEFADVDHGVKVARPQNASSVSEVT
jgi:hypothetical protein